MTLSRSTCPSTPHGAIGVPARSQAGGNVRGAWIVIGLIVCVIASPAWSWDRSEKTRQIRVTGHAQVASKPDRVSLDFGVVTRADSAREAAERNASESTAMVDALRKAFSEDAEISTSGYTLQPEYQYDKREGKRSPAGFSARNTVHVTLSDIAGAGRLIDTAVEAGANDVRGVRFGIADASDLERRALVAATADARAKAAALAKSLDVKLGKILRVEEGGGMSPPPTRLRMAMAESDSTPIEPSDVFFEATVSLAVEIVDK